MVSRVRGGGRRRRAAGGGGGGCVACGRAAAAWGCARARAHRGKRSHGRPRSGMAALALRKAKAFWKCPPQRTGNRGPRLAAQAVRAGPEKGRASAGGLVFGPRGRRLATASPRATTDICRRELVCCSRTMVGDGKHIEHVRDSNLCSRAKEGGKKSRHAYVGLAELRDRHPRTSVAYATQF